MRLRLAFIFVTGVLTLPSACGRNNAEFAGFSVEPVSRKPILANPIADEQEIYETIFQYRLEREGFKGTLFLSINGKDPSDEFMRRFSRISRSLKKVSGSHYSAGFLLDRSTNKIGVELFINNLTWTWPNTADVRGGRYCGGRCLDSGIYRLRKQNGRWAVEEYQILGIA